MLRYHYVYCLSCHIDVQYAKADMSMSGCPSRGC